MRRWDRLVDGYVEEYRARGVSTQSVEYTQARLDRWGGWLKRRRPRIAIEHIDAELLTRYIASCSSFRAKATVYAMLSTMRGFGHDSCAVIPGTGGFRKLRWTDPRRGKGRRGGLRVIYYYFPGEQQIWLITLYDRTKLQTLRRKKGKL
jgi:hypothetical protein